MATYKDKEYKAYHDRLNVTLSALKDLSTTNKEKVFFNDKGMKDVLPKLKDKDILNEIQWAISEEYIRLLKNITSLRETLNENNKKPGSEGLILTRAGDAYQKGLDFINEVLNSKEKNISHIRLTADVVENIYNVLLHPRSEPHLKSLKSGIRSLNYQLELEGWRGSLYKVGRLFASALCILAGATMMAVSVTSVFGLIISGGFGIYTKGKSFGPSSWGWRGFKCGMSMWDGPTLRQKKAAQSWFEELQHLKSEDENLQTKEAKTINASTSNKPMLLLSN